MPAFRPTFRASVDVGAPGTERSCFVDGDRPVGTLSLRASFSREPNMATTRSRREHLEQTRVLVVDDNIDAAHMLAELLRIDGHEVQVAHEGEGALDIATVFRPQLAILDIGLPGMDGYELAEKLRAKDGEVVLVALSGYGGEPYRRRSEEAGFSGYLLKPVDIATVRTAVQQLGNRL
jgi:CheY-like chemotaxis protein